MSEFDLDAAENNLAPTNVTDDEKEGVEEDINSADEGGPYMSLGLPDEMTANRAGDKDLSGGDFETEMESTKVGSNNVLANNQMAQFDRYP